MGEHNIQLGSIEHAASSDTSPCPGTSLRPTHLLGVQRAARQCEEGTRGLLEMPSRLERKVCQRPKKSNFKIGLEGLTSSLGSGRMKDEGWGQRLALGWENWEEQAETPSRAPMPDEPRPVTMRLPNQQASLA